ncbi:hypothetical protein LTR70_001040 [Exophiala xenobiotica]|uniref:Uncharacterized protein n=1 Tax=Lithohypha guttulata TaxID=1690604 RepID=A0ABR0KMW5_9EURO|nr:hypothetical protein LTR24_000770 [Lithohypha guttulata]KAK5328886.1 hypothetical protein LTR70_001040 [Exophiala xenobiotica]
MKHDLPMHSQTWQSAPRMRPVTIFRKRRLLGVLLVLAVVYLFIKYLPTDVPSVAHRTDSRTGRSQGRPFALDLAPKQNSGNTASEALGANQLYDGPVKFYHLAGSLRPHLYKEADSQENVLFMLYDLRSAASLTGLACEMAVYNSMNVHMGLLTPSDVSIEEIMAVTGVTVDGCPIFWHDARPDYNSRSSLDRQAVVVKAAIRHMHATLKPSVVVIDQQQASNIRFTKALQDKLNSLWTPLTILPNDALTSISWITSLDGKGLALMNQNQIDTIIQPYKESAGSLIRLLESIKSAHYAGLPLPRITVELPHTVDPFALHYIENFRWPQDSPISESKLILRRRIDDSKLSPTLATLRTLESFYPPTTPNSHVLILSPDVELSPSYLQYLYFLTLTYKYGSAGKRITGSLMGISLDLPSYRLDNQTPFLASNQPQPQSQPLLLHQTPSSTATLYFGDHWVELQNYISLRLRHDPDLTQTINNSPESKISPNHPAWLKPAQELMRARNTYILYPSFATTPGKKLLTIHTESTQAPEEFWKDPNPRSQSQSQSQPSTSDTTKNHNIPPPPHDDSNSDSTILTATADDTHNPDAPNANMDHEPAQSSIPQSLQTLLGLKDHETLPTDTELPLFSATGHLTDRDTSRAGAAAYGDRVSLELGGCRSLEKRNEMMIGQLEYLFC